MEIELIQSGMPIENIEDPEITDQIIDIIDGAKTPFEIDSENDDEEN